MPIYEYQCQKCRETTEVLQKSKDKPLEVCPKCGAAVVKLISSPAIQFKGNGWYVTDYANKNSSANGCQSGSKAESGADSKPGSGDAAKKKSEKAEKSDA